MTRLEKLSRRGKLAGFEKTSPTTFHAAAFGMLYDRLFVGEISPTETGSHLRMHTELKRTLPTVVAVVYLLTLWPGVLLTDSMLTTYFSWYPRATWVTYAWYIPLTLLAIPALRAQFRASQRAARAHGQETAQKIAKAIDAELIAAGEPGEQGGQSSSDAPGPAAPSGG